MSKILALTMNSSEFVPLTYGLHNIINLSCPDDYNINRLLNQFTDLLDVGGQVYATKIQAIRLWPECVRDVVAEISFTSYTQAATYLANPVRSVRPEDRALPEMLDLFNELDIFNTDEQFFDLIENLSVLQFIKLNDLVFTNPPCDMLELAKLLAETTL